MIKVLEFADVINRDDFIDTIIKYANRDKFEMSVCVRSEDHNIARPKFSADVKYKLLPGNSRRDAVQTAWRLSRLLKEWEIDVLHTHHFEQAIVGRLATKFYPKTKLVIGRHYSDSIYRQQNKIKKKGLLAIEQIINRSAARIIVPSVFIRDILLKQNISVDKIDVVLYGFDPGKYNKISINDVNAVKTEFETEGRFVFGNFSRLHEEKGHRYLIEAVASVINKVPNALVLIVGEGAERLAIEKQINALGLSQHIKLLGWRKDAMTIMSAVDIVVQSTLQEAFSQVMCEALWMGKPLIISNVSGAVDIITDDNGIMVEKGDSEALAKAMIELANHPNESSRLAENGKEFVNNQLTIDRMIGQYENALSKAAFQ